VTVRSEHFKSLLAGKEGENLEFKEGKRHYEFENLAKYACALANEGGGDFVLGVTDKRPRKVVGSLAFDQPERTRSGLRQNLKLSIDFTVFNDPDGRVLVFHIPPRPIGTPIKYKGIYWMRDGDSLVPMSEEMLRDIFSEVGHDFSSEICPGADLTDLDESAIEDFRQRWIEKSGNINLQTISQNQLLHDIEAATDNKPTYAALILFGSRKAVGRFLAQAEIIFEYRSSEASGPAQQRIEFRQGFFSYYEKLWQTINLRNDLQHFQDGLFVFDVPTFSERSIREAILNAVSHRDYQLGGSVFVRQFPRKLFLESPGGFPVGITVENILDRQSPRNRRIADILTKCGMVERSGQGMNLMFEQSIMHSKNVPDFSGTDRYQVTLCLDGQVQEPAFLRFLEQIGKEQLKSFGTQDFLLLDLVHREKPIPPAFVPRLKTLVSRGVVESIGRGRGVRYILSRNYYAMTDKKGVYTRKKGLDRETNKELLVKHIKLNQKEGSRLQELMQVLPGCTKGQVQSMMKELKAENRIHVVGAKRTARWYPGTH
jgi:ATP-dependent DNA helicase RecG